MGNMDYHCLRLRKSCGGALVLSCTYLPSLLHKHRGGVTGVEPPLEGVAENSGG